MKIILWIFIVLIGIGLVALPILSRCRVIDVDGNVIGYLSAVVTYLMAIVALLTLQQNSSLVLYQSQSSDYKQLMQAIGEMDASIMSEQKARGMDCTNMVNYKDARVHFYAAMSKLREKESQVYSCMTEDQARIFSNLCEPYIDDIFDEMVCFESLIAIMEIVDQSEHELTEGDVIKLLIVPARQTPRYLELNELMKISLESGFDVFKKNIALFTGKLTQRDEKLESNYAEGLRSVVSNAKDRVKQPSIQQIPCTTSFSPSTTIPQHSKQEREALVAWCVENGVKDYNFIENDLTVGRIPEQRIKALIEPIKKGDTIVVSEVSCLGRSLRRCIMNTISVINDKSALFLQKKTY